MGSAAASSSALRRSASSLSALARAASGMESAAHLAETSPRKTASVSLGSHDESSVPPTVLRSPSLAALAQSPRMPRQVSYSFLEPSPMLGVDAHSEAAQEDAKRVVLVEMARAFGSTALCLSGGAANSFYHLGVVKALLERGVLPRHISGASGGSLVAAFVCTHTDAELATALSKPAGLCKAFAAVGERTWLDMARSLRRTGALFDLEDWRAKLERHVCGDLTFAEAYQRTGRSLTVTVFNGDRHTRALNHKTAPDIVIASAVLASSAIPTLLPGVRLMRKRKTGAVEPFLTWGEFWRDGSFEQLRIFRMGAELTRAWHACREIPLQALSVVFGCSFFVVSQVNPHIVPFFFDASRSVATRSHGTGFLTSFAERALKADMRKWLQLVDEFRLLPKFFGTDFSRVWLGVNYGDATMLPPLRLDDYAHLASDPTPARMRHYVLGGERMAWPKLGWIEDRMRIELTIKAELKALTASVASKAREHAAATARES